MHALYYGTSKKNGYALYYRMEGVLSSCTRTHPLVKLLHLDVQFSSYCIILHPPAKLLYCGCILIKKNLPIERTIKKLVTSSVSYGT